MCVNVVQVGLAGNGEVFIETVRPLAHGMRVGITSDTQEVFVATLAARARRASGMSQAEVAETRGQVAEIALG